jgi:serine/threonine protein kinase
MQRTAVDGLPVRLREPHDLGFLARWGTVFRVLDEQDSGNLCFGVDGPEGRVFVKYAGAATVRYDGVVADAVDRLRAAATVYRELAHPTLVRLREHAETEHGVALVFDWTDAVSVGRQYEQRARLAHLSTAARVDAVQQIYDFSAHVAALGWVAIDLYDGSVMVDPATARVVLCDLDVYRRAPTVNDMGRMWGSTRFMSPEEYALGATIDEVSTVVTLGALAHTFLGDDAGKAREAWSGGDERFRIAARALEPDRDRRWPSIAALAQAWRDAGPPDPRT